MYLSEGLTEQKREKICNTDTMHQSAYSLDRKIFSKQSQLCLKLSSHLSLNKINYTSYACINSRQEGHMACKKLSVKKRQCQHEIFRMAKQMVKERHDITRLNCIKGASGKVIVDDKGIKDSWKEY